MKKRGRGQISIEYILIITLALMIIIPAVYLFRNYAFASNENLVENRIYEIGNTILVKAKTMYYYGPPSKTTLNIEMPPQVDNMYILAYINDTDPTSNEYFLGFQIAGKKEILLDSDVPLNVTSDNAVPCVNLDQNCDPPNVCYCFKDKFYAKGIKIYTIEAVDNCYSGNCIIIN